MKDQIKCRATGKTRYPDPGSAKEAMIRIKATGRFFDHIQSRRRNRRAGKPDQCRFYYCKDCHGWHLTSNEQQQSYKKHKKDRELQTKNLILNQQEAEDWKKDSLPFPDEKSNNNDEMV